METQLALRDWSEEVGEEPPFFWQQRPSSQNIERLPFNKENQTSQVNGFKGFSVYGKMQESGLIEIIPLIWTVAI